MKVTFTLLILVAACSVLSAQAFGEDKPESTNEPAAQARKADRPEWLEPYVFAVKLPKPEALVFEKRRKARYEPRSHRKSFTKKIVESAHGRALGVSRHEGRESDR